MKKLLIVLLTFGFTTVFSANVFAASTSIVTVNVVTFCNITSFNALSFGTITSLEAPTAGSADITVSCNVNKNYQIGISNGINAYPGGQCETCSPTSYDGRALASASGKRLRYELYTKDPNSVGHSSDYVWGWDPAFGLPTNFQNQLDGQILSTGERIHTVYAELFPLEGINSVNAPGSLLSGGSYSDTLTATIYY